MEEQFRRIAGSIFVNKFEDIYELNERIHHGEFSDVYKCRLKNRQTIRAVKCIPKPGNRENPVKNASLVLQLDHPNLVVIRDVLECPLNMYIIQDYINGPNLIEKIIKQKVYTEFNLSNYCSQILQGLQYMHEHQVYHGKLHGENILVQDERLCLVDYTYSNLFTRHAMTLLVNSTPSLCAPEMLRGESFSPSTDIWQLGILLFYCISGIQPFTGSPKKIFQNILNGLISYDASEWDQVSANGRSFVNDLLKLNVGKRLTVNQAFSHAWIREKIYRSTNLSQAQRNITVNQIEKNQKNQV